MFSKGKKIEVMRIIAFLVIFLNSFFLIFSKTLLVPEQFITIQQAGIVAHNEDTVSVNFGRPSGQRITVTSSRIFDKEITFEVRGGDEEKLLKILDRAHNLPTTNLSNRRDSGWGIPGMVNELDTFYDGMGDLRALVIDQQGNPSVTWIGRAQNGALTEWVYYSKWNGNNWGQEEFVHSPSSRTQVSKSSITIDSNNIPWISFAELNSYGRDDIFYTKWNGSGWDSAGLVNLPDSTEYDFSAEIAYGGGEIWIVWYGGPIAYPPIYKVFASHWDGTNWEPEILISPEGEGYHWFASITVDNSGRPHIVWCNSGNGRIYYRMRSDTGWTTPIWINDTSTVRCAGWAAPAIAIDDSEHIHVIWVGVSAGEPDCDIFYSKFDGQQWLAPFRLNYNDDYDELYPDIRASSPENIWAAWKKEIAFWEAYVFAAHFDGNAWSSEEQIDDSTQAYFNGGPCVALNENGEPWAVWNGLTRSVNHSDIYWNRYLTSSISESKSPNLFQIRLLRNFPNPFRHNTNISYCLTAPTHVRLRIYDSKGSLIKTLINDFQKSGSYTVSWDRTNEKGIKMNSGVYFCELSTDSFVDMKRAVLVQ